MPAQSPPSGKGSEEVKVTRVSAVPPSTNRRPVTRRLTPGSSFTTTPASMVRGALMVMLRVTW
jgi:hypothetical protein